MSVPNINNLKLDDIPPPIYSLIDRIASEFEAAKNENKQTSVKPYLLQVPAEYRHRLLRELNLIEHKVENPLSDPRSKSTMGPQDAESTQFSSHLTVKSVSDLPGKIGNYVPKYSLGNGGTGEVFAAIDANSANYVAIKIAHEFVTDAEDITRFFSEADNAESLRHPNIVACLGSGQEGARPFLVYELLDGLDLREITREKIQISLKQILWLIADVCQALQHAHDRLIVHRDIKPSNIMVLLEGATDIRNIPPDVRFKVKLLDFGLAKQMDAMSHLTKTGALLGTPLYMSPEQAAGVSELVDHRSDIYSIGVVFYELLTGQTPFLDRTESVVSRIQNEEVELLSKTHPAIPEDIATICQRCLRLNPNRRYQRIGAVAADIERYLSGEPIHAKSIGRFERFASYWQRKQLTRPAIAAVAAMICTVFVATLFFWLQPPKVRLPVQEKTLELVSKLPSSLHDQQVVQTVLVDAKIEDIIYLRDALKNHVEKFAQMVERQRSMRFGLFSADAADEETQIHNAELILCSLAQEQFIDQVDFQELAIWLADRIERQGLTSPSMWQEILAPIASDLGHELKDLYDQERNIEKRTAQCQLLILLSGDDEKKLVSYVDDAVPAELPYWSQAIGKLDLPPSELLEVEFDSLQMESISIDEDRFGVLSNRIIVRYLLSDQDVLRQAFYDRPDPRLRTNVIHGLVASNAPLNNLVEILLQEERPDVQYSMCIFMGMLNPNRLNASLRSKTQKWFIDAYRTNPDPGVHSMCGVLLEKWGRIGERRKIDSELQMQNDKAEQSWFVDRFGTAFAVIDTPNEITIGQRDSAISSGPVPLTKVSMGYQYAISMEILSSDLIKQAGIPRETSRLSYDECLDICNWLNRAAGYALIPKNVEYDENLYPIGFRQWKGYRLPTSAEWEYACRGLTRTERFFGTTETQFSDEYIRKNGSKRPMLSNRFGLHQIFSSRNIMLNKLKKGYLIRGSTADTADKFKIVSTGILQPGESLETDIRLVLIR